jgi:hypothetical protein
MAKTPDAIHITIVTKQPLREKNGLSRLLDALEEDDYWLPTHWGPDERATEPYDRGLMVAEVEKFEHDYYIPGVHRRKPPRYKSYFSAKSSGYNYLKVLFESTIRRKDIHPIFEFGNALADQLQPEFGFVHPIWRLGSVSQDYSASGIIQFKDLEKYGPNALCARTWLGAYIVDLIGIETLESTGLPIVKTFWGGVQIDLVEDPWKSEFDMLRTSQVNVMQKLEKCGVFGSYRPKGNIAGSKWTPIQNNEV